MSVTLRIAATTWTSDSMLPLACLVPTLYNHHLLRERRLFHVPKTHSLVCRTLVSSVGQDFSTVTWWVGACVRCYWIAKTKLATGRCLAATEMLWNIRLRSLVVQAAEGPSKPLGFPRLYPSPHFLLVYRMLLYSDSAAAANDDEECVVMNRRDYGKLLEWVCPSPCWAVTSFKLRSRPARIDSVHFSCWVVSTANRNYSAPAFWSVMRIYARCSPTFCYCRRSVLIKEHCSASPVVVLDFLQEVLSGKQVSFCRRGSTTGVQIASTWT
jgi:hypothetical protein